MAEEIYQVVLKTVQTIINAKKKKKSGKKKKKREQSKHEKEIRRRDASACTLLCILHEKEHISHKDWGCGKRNARTRKQLLSVKILKQQSRGKRDAINNCYKSVHPSYDWQL